MLTALVSRAKRVADESLARANDALQPHETTNIIFVTLYEVHWRDREALFEAMRRLDEARDELRAAAAERTVRDKPSSSTAGRRSNNRGDAGARKAGALRPSANRQDDEGRFADDNPKCAGSRQNAVRDAMPERQWRCNPASRL